MSHCIYFIYVRFTYVYSTYSHVTVLLLFIDLGFHVKLLMCTCIVKRCTLVLGANDRDVSFSDISWPCKTFVCHFHRSQIGCLETYLWISILRNHDGTRAHLWAGLNTSSWWQTQEMCFLAVRFWRMPESQWRTTGLKALTTKVSKVSIVLLLKTFPLC